MSVLTTIEGGASASAAFLREYFRGTEGRIYLAAIRNPKSELHPGEIDNLLTREPGDVARFVAAYDRPECDCAIYYCTATLRDGQAKRDAAGCREFPGLFADCDDANHELERDRIVALLDSLECPPTMIVNSGHGLQPHWLLDEPSENAERIVAARKKLQALVASDAVHDAPRFMRLPGSHNSKRGDWLPVEIVAQHPERRYALEALEEWLDTAEVAIPRKLKPAKTDGVAPDTPFVLPPAAGNGTDHRRGAAWARRALEESARELANVGEGGRHKTLVDKSVRMGTMVARGWIDVQEVRGGLFAASQACGQIKDYGVGHFEKALADGLKYGLAMPHPDLPDNDRLPGDPLRDEPTPHIEYVAGPSNGAAKINTAEPTAAFTFNPAPYAFPAPASIPPREWLFGRHYIRGAVGASIGAPGRLKSTTSLTEIIGMTVGRDLMTGETLASGPLRAAYLNGEEVEDELDRRVAAVCQRFQLERADCGGRLFVRSTRDNPIRVAVRGPRGDAMVHGAVVAALADWCSRNQIDAIAVDPLISFHAVRESDNGDMDLVCKEAFGAIAGKTRSVDLVHHPRKLAPGESVTTVDDARGASALLGAVRLARTFNFMTTAEAAQVGIGEDDRRRHVKIENGKNNPGPIGKAHWVRIETEILPNGDEVACSTLWKLPNPFDRVSVGVTM